MNLSANDIGDGGAIALAESLKATLVMRFRPVRAKLFLWPARTQPHRRVICVTSVFRCCSMGVARADVFHMCSCDKMSCGHVTARALASVHAAETLDISASAAGVNAEQSLARATRAINMLLKRRRERC